MKKHIYTFALLLCALLTLQSCYKDTGNYVYTTEGGALTISSEFTNSAYGVSTDDYRFKVGTPVEIEAEYVINDPMLTEDQLAFEWHFGDEVTSTEKTFRMEGLGAALYTGLLVITDLRYDTKYSSAFGFAVEDLYTKGWAVLSEKDGYSVLSYLTLDDELNPTFIDDVYGKSNGGARLAAGVRDISYHMYLTRPYTFGLNIVQPGEEGPIELNPNNMSVIGKYNDRFISSVGDKEFSTIANTNTTKGDAYTYAFTSDNELYIRQESKFDNAIVPHTGYFPAAPVTVEGDMSISHVLHTDIICQEQTTEWGASLVAYDQLNSRCVMLNGMMVYPFTESFHYEDFGIPYKGSAGYDGTDSYEDIVVPGPDDLSEYNVIGMYGLGFDTDWFMGWDKRISVAMLLQRKSDGKFFFLTYRIEDYYGARFRLEIDLFFPLPEDITVDPDNFIGTNNMGGPTNILYFMANGNKDLYFLDAIYGTCRKIYSSADEVTAISMGEIQDIMLAMDSFFGDPVTWPPYYEKLLVGKKNGQLDVVQIDMAARASGNAPVVATMNPGVGEIRHMTYLRYEAWAF